ncbi:MAG: hypothetical protein ABWX68_07120 [Arthrobacter sp.]|uniref:hypothetical protein n=1 Tax=Arthrobacter sp. TaxID=1667 RepID=UPI00347DCB61
MGSGTLRAHRRPNNTPDGTRRPTHLRALAAGFTTPPHRSGTPRPPRQAGTKQQRFKDGSGDWPVREHRINESASGPSRLRNAPGRDNALIAFENQGTDGADKYLEWGRTAGIPVTPVGMMNKNSPAIDLFAGTDPIEMKAANFVAPMT